MDYHLKPIAKTCTATGREFAPGVPCHSALVELNGKLVRFDFSEDGWTGPPDGTIGFWQSIVPEPTETAAKPLDADALMRYFEQLCEDASPAQDKFRYVVALLLLQKRRLKLEGSRHDGDIKFLELLGSRGEGTFEVRDQHLKDDEIGQLQQALNAHLATEWS
jgi:hypothetical protein